MLKNWKKHYTIIAGIALSSLLQSCTTKVEFKNDYHKILSERMDAQPADVPTSNNVVAIKGVIKKGVYKSPAHGWSFKVPFPEQQRSVFDQELGDKVSASAIDTAGNFIEVRSSGSADFKSFKSDIKRVFGKDIRTIKIEGVDVSFAAIKLNNRSLQKIGDTPNDILACRAFFIANNKTIRVTAGISPEIFERSYNLSASMRKAFSQCKSTTTDIIRSYKRSRR